MAYLSAIDAYAQVTTPQFVLLALTIQVVTPLCLTALSSLTYPAGSVFSRPFPFLNEDNTSLAYAGPPLPVQHNPFLDSIRSRRRNQEYCKGSFYGPCTRLTIWSGERVHYGDTPEARAP